MELLLIQELTPIVETQSLIADHQFGFSKKHGRIEQVHRVVDVINTALEEKKVLHCRFSRHLPSF